MAEGAFERWGLLNADLKSCWVTTKARDLESLNLFARRVAKSAAVVKSEEMRQHENRIGWELLRQAWGGEW